MLSGLPRHDTTAGTTVELREGNNNDASPHHNRTVNKGKSHTNRQHRLKSKYIAKEIGIAPSELEDVEMVREQHPR